MTRYTNVGIKRSFLQAGFDKEAGEAVASSSTFPNNISIASTGQSSEVQADGPTTKKRKKSKKSTEASSGGSAIKEKSTAERTADEAVLEETRDVKKSTSKKVNAAGYLRRKQREPGQSASEQRRQKRIHDRLAETTCFACREKGHAARDCPTALEGQGVDGDPNQSGGPKTKGVPAMGICYRCGSKKHSLSRCRATENPSNPLPFASCFVCSGKGHLASSCPQNKAKGVYPNGGSCKLCGETTHLARNCELRNQQRAQTAVIVGTGTTAGADEDDFHSFKRTNTELDQDERKVRAAVKEMAKKPPTNPVSVSRARMASAQAPAKKVIVF